MQARASTTSIPSSFGKYRLIAELGTGGMANVFLAVMQAHGGFHKLVVLKVPRDDVTQDPSLLAMFLDEARLAARLMHPNVVQTYEVIREAGRDIIVMEYLDGFTLNEAIGRGHVADKPLPPALHLRIVSEALKGLHYAHEARDFDGAPLDLVHRDISPHNLFLTFDGQVKLLDFGIAKAAMQSHQTEFGTFKGKIRYMPVEQLAGANMDRRTDVFAVGAMIWEAAVGERLWRTKNDVEVISAIVAGEIPMPKDVRPDVPDALDAICRKALAHRKDDRYESCLALQHDLDAYLAGLSTRPRLRDMVSYLDTVLGEQRASRRQVIEEQLRSVTLRPSVQLASLASAEAAAATPSTAPMPSVPVVGTVTTSATPPSATTEVPQIRRRSSAWLAAPLAVLALAALAVTGVIIGRASKRLTEPAPSAAALSAPSPSTAAEAPSESTSVEAREAPPPLEPSASAATTMGHAHGGFRWRPPPRPSASSKPPPRASATEAPAQPSSTATAQPTRPDLGY